jgi:hypothetical protein
MNKFNVLETCENMAKELSQKANHNKKESLWSFKLIMTLTLVTPILINIADDWIWGKLLPSICAAIASFLTAWLKLRKPESLWGLYRSSQREIENEIRYYQSDISPYGVGDSGKILIKNVTEIFNNTHIGWLKLVPSAEGLPKNISPQSKE